MTRYTAQITEHNSITGVSAVQPGAAVGTVSASDQDGASTLAGQVEYDIVSGHLLDNVVLFSVDSTVSCQQQR